MLINTSFDVGAEVFVVDFAELVGFYTWGPAKVVSIGTETREGYHGVFYKVEGVKETSYHEEDLHPSGDLVAAHADAKRREADEVDRAKACEEVARRGDVPRPELADSEIDELKRMISISRTNRVAERERREEVILQARAIMGARDSSMQQKLQYLAELL